MGFYKIHDFYVEEHEQHENVKIGWKAFEWVQKRIIHLFVN